MLLLVVKSNNYSINNFQKLTLFLVTIDSDINFQNFASIRNFDFPSLPLIPSFLYLIFNFHQHYKNMKVLNLVDQNI